MKKFSLILCVFTLMYDFGYFMKYKATEGWSGWTITYLICTLVIAVIAGIELATLPQDW